MRPSSSVVLLTALLGAIGCRPSVAETETGIDTEVPSDSAGNDTDTDDTEAPQSCAGAEPILDASGAPTGYERCPDGGIDRAASKAVPSTVLTDSCQSDADCGDGLACLIDATATDIVVSQCVAVECTTNTDCASGRCGLSSFEDPCGLQLGLVCRTAADACASDTDCSESWHQCTTWGLGNPFTCNGDSCDIGRPLLVDDEPRVAGAVERKDWRHLIDGLDAVPAEHRARLAAHWSRVAAMEHASVASFSRFSLQLMALGAPPELLTQTHQAALDEVRHAELAYGVASALGPGPRGPGRLDLSGVSMSTEPANVLAALISEACIVETLGVSEAREAAARCEVPALRELIEQIADDEQRHAELAWASLAWMLEAFPELREDASRRLAEGVVRAGMGRFARGSDGLPSLGWLGGQERLRVHRVASKEVLRPAMAAVLGRVAA